MDQLTVSVWNAIRKKYLVILVLKIILYRQTICIIAIVLPLQNFVSQFLFLKTQVHSRLLPTFALFLILFIRKYIRPQTLFVQCLTFGKIAYIHPDLTFFSLIFDAEIEP